MALLEIAAVEHLRRMWPRTELEQHRHQGKSRNGLACRRALGRELLQGRRDENAEPLIGRQDARFATIVHEGSPRNRLGQTGLLSD
jgi:hypothetical protein